MTQRVLVNGELVWLKRYDSGRRSLRLGLLDVVARRLGLEPLRPPPHPGGTRAMRLERRRIEQLAAQGVHVPKVVEARPDALLLSDIGPSLSSRLRACDSPERLDGLVAAAAGAIRRAHDRGAYLGQPWPRNLTVQGDRIGFLDFEEDPLDVMPLAQAQARDWLLFAHGATRFYRERPDALAHILRDALRTAPAEVTGSMAAVGARLEPLTRRLRGLGTSARTLWRSTTVIRSATAPLLFAVTVWLGWDWLDDGQLDLLLLLM